MVAVLLVLMALFVLSAPFLVTVRNADQASAESADRSVLRVTLDAADRHAVAELSGSHPALDPTPYYDDLEELTVASRFPGDFLATDDPQQVMWGLEAEDVAARIDLASASPHVFANLIGGAARLTGQCKDKDGALEVSSTEGFLPEGVVLVDDELMGYAELEPTKLGKLVRGLLVKLDADGKPPECGPRPPGPHEVGAFVLDQRAWALCEWRIAPNYPKGKLRAYEGIEQVREAKDFVLAPEFGREAYLALERTTSTFGHVRAGAVWQRWVRVVGDPAGEPQYGCKLPVDDLRWFNPGTTVWITDGTNSEYALVRSTERGAPGTIEGGKLVLSEPLRARYEAFETVVAPLARTPVNVNTAMPEVLHALWTNLKLRGKSARITSGEAEDLVDLVLVSRPFTGFEDFLRRVVLPAAGLDELPKDAPVRPEKLEELARESKLDAHGVRSLAGFLDADDARALYKNALNANDNELEFATMPLCFTARDVYQLALRASVNAPSGIERARGSRELIELIVPQRDLMSVWTRQEDFDEAPRLGLQAAGWMSGPVPTSRYDPLYGEISSLRWPTRARAHLGPHDSTPSVDPLADTNQVYTFATRDDEAGWAQLAPYREDDKARKASYALHFDDESKELEGRYLPDGAAPLDLAKLGWSGAGSLMQGMAASLWIKPRELEEGAKLLDVAGPFSDSDRLSLLFEEGNLVLRVLDGAGDHETSTFKERAEILFPLSGEGAGVPKDTWSHVQIAVDGTRPDQMALWVDGRRSDHTPGLTRLTSGISGESDSIPVESTQGFPEKCVVRIGRELIEVTKRNEKSFQAKFQSTGENAGFGGRLAREQFAGVEGAELNQGLYKSTDHPDGSTVQLYGYSLPFLGNLPSAGSALGVSLGPFAVARVAGIVKGGDERMENRMEPIETTLTSGNPLLLGWGLDSQKDDVEALVLEPADPNGDRNKVMEAFSTSGGYAAILSTKWNLTVTEFGGGSTTVVNDKYGVRLWGVEVIRYSGYEGNHLRLDRRGDALTGLPMLRPPNVDEDVEGRSSFIFWFNEPFTDTSWSDQNMQLSAQTMVIPISIPSGGSGGITGFPPGAPGRSEFAQITHVGGDADLTEWVRYDDVAPDGHLVRDESNALLAANYAAHANVKAIDFTGDKNPPAGGGPGGSGGRGVAGRSNSMAMSARDPVVRSFARTPSAGTPLQRGQSIWNYHMGEPEDENFVITRAVGSQFQFRGVLGTYSHAHQAGPMVLPTFRMRELDETAGYPGRFDHVTMFLDDPAEPGFQSVVHRAHRPNDYTAYYWTDPLGGSFAAEKGPAPTPEPQTGIVVGANYVALERPMSIFVPASPITDPPIDSRLLARMALFPSGELPREVRQGQLGGDAFDGGGRSGPGSVPSATVDEALFFPNFFGELSGMPMQLVLANDLGENDKTFTVVKDQARTTLGDIGVEDESAGKKGGAKSGASNSGKSSSGTPVNVLANLPEHGGLLRMGDELLCYDSYDASGTVVVFTIPAAGRGLLGTDPQPHREEEGISYIGSLPLGILGANVGADDAQIPLLEEPKGFPLHGTVRIEDELVHFSRLQGQILEMPRASVEPGEMDGKGPGLFRGRYGTQRSSHSAGTPVILFPFRYWDRWSELADAPELTYYELACEQPDAYWKRVFWKTEEASYPGSQLGVLQRTNADTPWDAPPDDTNGLEFLWDGKLDGGGNPVNVQADRVEWRVFVRHLPGSFDYATGLSHGWKTTPRLTLFGVEYMGPNRTLARVDR